MKKCISSCLLIKIKSKYIIEKIFDYIINRDFKYKLFLYSKYIKYKLDITVYDYQKIYLDGLRIDFEKYLNFINNKYPDDFNPSYLTIQLKKNLSNYNLDINDVLLYVINYFSKYANNFYENDIDKKFNYKYNGKSIIIFSPFFDCLSKNDIFEKIFNIHISTKEIKKFALKNEYTTIFKNMNKNRSKYSTISFVFNDSKDIDFLGDFKINFKQIKSLNLRKEKNSNFDNYTYFLNKFFSFKDISKNLVYLNIEPFKSDLLEEECDLLMNINKFKSLETLILNNFKFKFVNNFILDLDNLKTLEIRFCENLILGKKMCQRIKTLYLISSYIISEDNNSLKFPELEDLTSSLNFTFKNNIDFISLEKLKRLNSSLDIFMHLKTFSLEYAKLLSINPKKKKSIEEEKRFLNRIFYYKNLKAIEFGIDFVNDYEMEIMNGKNNSIETMKLYYYIAQQDCILFDLLKKFPNLSDITLYSINRSKTTTIEIKENEQCKVDKISLTVNGNNNIKFYTKPFHYFIKFELNIRNKITNLKEFFPIFETVARLYSIVLLNFN